MTIETKVTSDGAAVTIYIRGRFDFSVVNQFREAYEAHKQKKHFYIDMRQTEHMDSSALGMLLNMRSYLGSDAIKIDIINCSPGIRKILEIAKFDKKFAIS
ncbi:STAS domain-containing protein [Hahella sp. KA22]|nr:anti-sigma factor antagonist [Hahella sp. KA22]QAY58323.1 STAS domain-containing protein [Hahella sp. KA22]